MTVTDKYKQLQQLFVPFLFYFFNNNIVYIAEKTGWSLYPLLTMIDAGGIRTCVHLHVSHPLYHCVKNTNC